MTLEVRHDELLLHRVGEQGGGVLMVGLAALNLKGNSRAGRRETGRTAEQQNETEMFHCNFPQKPPQGEAENNP